MIGDYKLNNIYNEDSLLAIKHIPDNSVDLVVTDPPYIMNYKTGRRKDNNHRFTKVIQGDDDESLIEDIIPELFRVMKENTTMYMFCNSIKIDFFKQEIEKLFKIKNIIVWVKNNHTAGDLNGSFGRQYEFIIVADKGRKEINGYRYTDVWEFDKVAGYELSHQNQKPFRLIERCINASSEKGDIVLDVFMGSGTTGEVAQSLDRRFVGFEIDKDYHKIAVDRINGIDAHGQTSIFTNFENIGGDKK